LTPKVSYFICTLPRSGSWLLSESLEGTGIAGRPREYFEPKLFQHLPIEGRKDAIETIVRKGTTENGVFGVKFHWYQFEWAPRLLNFNGKGNAPVPLLMAEQFPNLRYVWLSRDDKVRQAVSYFRATKTGQWWKILGVNADEQPETPEFDFDRIQYLERLLLKHEAQWQKYFEEHDIDPLVLVYEEFAEYHAPAVREVLAFVGITHPEQMEVRPRLQRQSDSLTEEWVERYIGMKKTRAI
jgi:trehalose 2-sulfotransferase